MKALPLIPGQLYIVVNCDTLNSEKIAATNGAHAIAEYIKRNFDIEEQLEMFQTIKYRNGYIQLSYYDGIEKIRAHVNIPTRDGKGILWTRHEKECISILSAKQFISRAENLGV